MDVWFFCRHFVKKLVLASELGFFNPPPLGAHMVNDSDVRGMPKSAFFTYNCNNTIFKFLLKLISYKIFACTGSFGTPHILEHIISLTIQIRLWEVRQDNDMRHVVTILPIFAHHLDHSFEITQGKIKCNARFETIYKCVTLKYRLGKHFSNWK